MNKDFKESEELENSKRPVEWLFNKFIEIVYPNDKKESMPIEQYNQLRDTYFCASSAIFDLLITISSLSESRSDKFMQRLNDELKSFEKGITNLSGPVSFN